MAIEVVELGAGVDGMNLDLPTILKLIWTTGLGLFVMPDLLKDKKF